MTAEETRKWLYFQANKEEVKIFIHIHQISRHFDDLTGISRDIYQSLRCMTPFNLAVVDEWRQESARHWEAIDESLDAIEDFLSRGSVNMPDGLDYSVRFEVQEA